LGAGDPSGRVVSGKMISDLIAQVAGKVVEFRKVFSGSLQQVDCGSRGSIEVSETQRLSSA
jgi:glycine cleavage system H lipoate-binding protein